MFPLRFIYLDLLSGWRAALPGSRTVTDHALSVVDSIKSEVARVTLLLGVGVTATRTTETFRSTLGDVPFIC